MGCSMGNASASERKAIARFGAGHGFSINPIAVPLAPTKGTSGRLSKKEPFVITKKVSKVEEVNQEGKPQQKQGNKVRVRSRNLRLRRGVSAGDESFSSLNKTVSVTNNSAVVTSIVEPIYGGANKMANKSVSINKKSRGISYGLKPQRSAAASIQIDPKKKTLNDDAKNSSDELGNEYEMGKPKKVILPLSTSLQSSFGLNTKVNSKKESNSKTHEHQVLKEDRFKSPVRQVPKSKFSSSHMKGDESFGYLFQNSPKKDLQLIPGRKIETGKKIRIKGHELSTPVKTKVKNEALQFPLQGQGWSTLGCHIVKKGKNKRHKTEARQSDYQENDSVLKEDASRYSAPKDDSSTSMIEEFSIPKPLSEDKGPLGYECSLEVDC